MRRGRRERCKCRRDLRIIILGCDPKLRQVASQAFPSISVASRFRISSTPGGPRDHDYRGVRPCYDSIPCRGLSFPWRPTRAAKPCHGPDDAIPWHTIDAHRPHARACAAAVTRSVERSVERSAGALWAGGSAGVFDGDDDADDAFCCCCCCCCCDAADAADAASAAHCCRRRLRMRG